jgi:hypothetical protein
MARVLQTANAPGEFVALPGFSWPGAEGCLAILFPAPSPIRAPAAYAGLMDAMRDRDGLAITKSGEIIPRFAECIGKCVGLEVTHGSRGAHDFALEALRQGMVGAFVGGGSPDHGAVGATSLTGVRVASLSRSNLLEAIRARQTWATNGERIVVAFDVDLEGDLPRLTVRGVGTAPIEQIEMYRNGKLVFQTHDLPKTEEFDLSWDDADLLTLDCLDRTVAYHARIVQTSLNAYDPSRHDVAITSPVEIVPSARHFDTSHARRGGAIQRPPGAALASLRAAWSSLRVDPERPLRAELPHGVVPRWTSLQITDLRAAAQELSRLAAQDSVLVKLARDAMALGSIAEALTVARGASEKIDRALLEDRPTRAVVARLQSEARQVHEASARAQTAGRGADWNALQEEWFAARWVTTASSDLLRRVAEFAALAERSAPIATFESKQRVSELVLALDPRVLAARAVETARTRSLAHELDAHWGFTEAEPTEAGEAIAFRVRLVVPGSPVARLGGLIEGFAWEVPFERDAAGWVAAVPTKWLPARTDPRLTISFDHPTLVERAYLEEPGGAPTRARGIVERLTFARSGEAARAILEAATDSVDVSLVGAGSGAPHVYWTGVVPKGETSLAFPASALRDYEHFAAQWGFAGWTRSAGTTVPGYDAAEPIGFGASPDGRAVLGFADGIVFVDPYTGATESYAYPPGRAHDVGRPFAALPLGEGVLVRASAGPEGWVSRFDLESATWNEVPPGPEVGSLAAHPDGGYAWLAGKTLRRRLPGGDDGPPLVLDVTGELFGFDPAGNAIVGLAEGGAGRVSAATGALLATIRGTPLAVDASGAVLVLERLEPPDPIVARRVLLGRVLPDGSSGGSFWIDTKPAPGLDPGIRIAKRADGSLLVLGGSTWWKRGPRNDWWGASVEAWNSVWAGRTLVPNAHF